MTTDYQTALQIVTAAKDDLIPVPANVAHFRKYLYTLAAAKQLKFVTKVQGKKLIVKRVNYYKL